LAFCQNASGQAFLQDDEMAPDIMEVYTHDTLFQKEYSKTLGFQVTESNNPRLITRVTDWIGTPYRHAGFSKAGIDCSGFISKMYEEIYGMNLTHSSSSMIYQMNELVGREDMQEGDIIFFKIHRNRISHVGMYLGDHKFIHASSSRGVVVDDIRSPYYAKAFYKAGRPYYTPVNQFKEEEYSSK